MRSRVDGKPQPFFRPAERKSAGLPPRRIFDRRGHILGALRAQSDTSPMPDSISPVQPQDRRPLLPACLISVKDVIPIFARLPSSPSTSGSGINKATPTKCERQYSERLGESDHPEKATELHSCGSGREGHSSCQQARKRTSRAVGRLAGLAIHPAGLLRGN